MAERMTRREAWSYYEGVLTNAAEAEKGHAACIDTTTGALVAAVAGNANLLTIGVFDETLTGDGSITVRVRLSREIWLDIFANDVTNAVAAVDVGSACYWLDSETVSSDATGNSVAGRVWKATSSQVWVESGLSLGVDPVA